MVCDDLAYGIKSQTVKRFIKPVEYYAYVDRRGIVEDVLGYSFGDIILHTGVEYRQRYKYQIIRSTYN